VSSLSAFVTAGAGFLLAVLWFDLMFDVQVLAHPEGDLPEETLSSITGYYARVTTAARPMNRLISAAMLAMLAAIVLEIARGEPREWVAWASLGLALPPIALAGARIVPRAVRLGRRIDAPQRQSALAREIFRGHLLCAIMIAALLVLQLSFA
jgi:hypothetical protein